MKLELRGVTKRFGSLVANDSIDLVVEPGEIHALLGENGAGKSTLMNVLYGLYHPDAGEILLDGRPESFAGPGEAIASGIGMVHQHFMLIPVFTVAENVMLGHEWTTGRVGVLSRRTARAQVRKLSDEFGMRVDPDALVGDLPVGVQQRVEILKALIRHAEVLILDEPTAVLTPQEIDDLIQVMRDLKASGTSIVFITHKLREVKAIADKITVIRRGKVVGQARPNSSEAELATMMVGRDVALTVEKGPAEPGTSPGDRRSCREGRPRHGHRRRVSLTYVGRSGSGGVQATARRVGRDAAGAAHPRLRFHPTGRRCHHDRDAHQILDRAVGSSRRTVSGTGWWPASPSREPCSTRATVSRTPAADHAVRADRANARARVREFDIRTSSIDAPATLSEATSRSSSSPASCRVPCGCSSPHSPPAAWMSVLRSSSTDEWSPSGTEAPLWCSCRPSSTRCSGWLTGSQ